MVTRSWDMRPSISFGPAVELFLTLLPEDDGEARYLVRRIPATRVRRA